MQMTYTGANNEGTAPDPDPKEQMASFSPHYPRRPCRPCGQCHFARLRRAYHLPEPVLFPHHPRMCVLRKAGFCILGHSSSILDPDHLSRLLATTVSGAVLAHHARQAVFDSLTSFASALSHLTQSMP